MQLFQVFQGSNPGPFFLSLLFLSFLSMQVFRAIRRSSITRQSSLTLHTFPPTLQSSIPNLTVILMRSHWLAPAAPLVALLFSSSTTYGMIIWCCLHIIVSFPTSVTVYIFEHGVPGKEQPFFRLLPLLPLGLLG